MHKVAFVFIILAVVCHGRRSELQSAKNDLLKLARTANAEEQAGKSKFTNAQVSAKTKHEYKWLKPFAMLLLACNQADAFGSTQTPTLPVVDQSFSAYDWLANLRDPATLVAGAALSSAYSLDQELQPKKNDKRWVSTVKKMGKLLLVSSFAFEIYCVFASTVTGTMLLAQGVPNPLSTTALGMLNREAEYEYLLSRVFFFQGLLNWLAGVTMHALLPKAGITMSSKRLQMATAGAIATITSYMLAFFNKHVQYYPNYVAMLTRLGQLAIEKNYLEGFQPLPIVALIPLGVTVFNAVLSLADFKNDAPFEEVEEEEE